LDIDYLFLPTLFQDIRILLEHLPPLEILRLNLSLDIMEPCGQVHTNIADSRSPIVRFFVLLFVELRTLALTVSIFGGILVEPVYVVNNPAQAGSLNQGYPEPLLLPDLKTLPPANLKLALNPETGNKTIRFSIYILNRGGCAGDEGTIQRKNGTVHVSPRSSMALISSGQKGDRRILLPRISQPLALGGFQQYRSGRLSVWKTGKCRGQQ
jgi:hypothetical protein